MAGAETAQAIAMAEVVVEALAVVQRALLTGLDRQVRLVVQLVLVLVVHTETQVVVDHTQAMVVVGA